MSGCFIEYLNYYRPKETIEVEKVLNQLNLPANHKNYILKYSHLNRICVENKLNCYTMFDEIMADCLKTIPAQKISYLLFSGEDRFVNNSISVPYYLVGRYQLDKASIVTINQGCSSALQSLELAEHIVKSNEDKKVLIASISKVDTLEKRFVWPTVIGDGSGIMVVSGKGKIKVLNCCSHSDGLRTLAHFWNPPAEKTAPDIFEEEKQIIGNLKKLIQNLLHSSNLSIHEISLVIPQNANHLICRMHAKAIQASLDQFFVENIPVCGHIGSVDDTINLKDAIRSGLVKPQDKVIIFSVGEIGGNMNYSAALLEICT